MAETVGPFADLFELASRTHKIYRRKDITPAPTADASCAERVARGAPARDAPMLLQSAAERLPARGRSADPRPLRAAERAGEPGVRGRSSSADGPRRFSRRRPGSRRRTSCGWPARACSWSCAARSTEAKTTQAPVGSRASATSPTAATTSTFTLRVLPVSAPQIGRLSLLVLFESERLGRVVRGRRRPRRGTARRPSATWTGCARSSAASKEYLQSIVDAAGGREPGAARRPRGGAVEQRGAAEHERRARDDEGGAAVVQRGADAPSTSSFRTATASWTFSPTICRTSSAAPTCRWSPSAAISHPPADTRRPAGVQPVWPSDIGRSIDAHQVRPRRRRHRPHRRERHRVDAAARAARTGSGRPLVAAAGPAVP